MKTIATPSGWMGSGLLLVGLGLTSNLSAQATVLDGELFVSTNGQVSFYEVQFESDVYYYVDVISPTISLSAAAFSFVSDAPTVGGPGEEPLRPRGGGAPSGFSNLEGWGTYVFSENQWNAGPLIQIASQIVSTTSYGTFDELFGLTDNYVAIFTDHLNQGPLTEALDVDGIPTDNDAPHFGRFSGLSSTEGLFIDDNAQLIASTVPEPSTSLLLGLMALSLSYRRKR